MTNEEKLSEVLSRLETQKDWKLFNALTDQGRKLVRDTLEISSSIDNEERFTEKVFPIEETRNQFLFRALTYLSKWIIYLTGLYTILEKFIERFINS